MKTILGDRIKELITELENIHTCDQLSHQRSGWFEAFMTRMLCRILKNNRESGA